MTQPDPAYHGLTFYETFGDFGYTMKTRAVGLRDLGPSLSPLNAFMILTGIEIAPCAHGPSRLECQKDRRFSRKSPRRRVGLLCRPQVEPLL